MKQMFIGGEGTLGIITKVAIQCPAKPSSVQVTYLAVPSFQHAQKVFQKAKQHLGEILSAFEFLDHHSLIITLKNLSFIKNPLPDTQVRMLWTVTLQLFMLQRMCATDCYIAAVHAQAQLSRAFLGCHMYICLSVCSQAIGNA